VQLRSPWGLREQTRQTWSCNRGSAGGAPRRL